MGVVGQRHALAASVPPEMTRYPLYTVGLDGCGISRPPPGLDHRIALPVTSRG